jgi:predicted amidohydrolase
MTSNSNFKRRVRSRANKTGESYSTALRHFRPAPVGDDEMPARTTMRLAVAQTILREDPRRSDELRQSGRDIRRLVRQAHDQGARLVHFPEGATCSPHKLAMSVHGPGKVGPSDWDRFLWPVLHEELAATASLAGELKLWIVLGSVHRLTPPNRPYNSLYVISDRGTVATRYDERLLSNTKVSYMYSPGSDPVTFQVDGYRFGCALGMEAHFPEIFSEYERLDVDCVLFSSTGEAKPGGPGVFAIEVQGHAAANSYWVSFAVGAQQSTVAPAGVVVPGGQWLARCPSDGRAAVSVVDLDDGTETVASALRHARPWRRKARAGVYDPHLVRDDPRSTDQAGF